MILPYETIGPPHPLDQACTPRKAFPSVAVDDGDGDDSGESGNGSKDREKPALSLDMCF